MKTNERITITYLFKNLEGDTLKECYPYFSGELRDAPWATLEPYGFEMNPGSRTEIKLVLDRPPKGFYQDIFQISCDRYVEGEFLERVDTIDPHEAPSYSLLVAEAGAGQDYAIKPADNTWRPVLNGGETKTVPVTIANLGSVPLLVDFSNARANNGMLLIEPVKFTVPIQEIKVVAMTYTAPQRFESLNESFKFMVGDFEETFYINAESSFGLESIFSIGTFSLIGGATKVGGLGIPNWILTVLFMVAVYYYVFVISKESKFTKNLVKRFKRKK
jgi:hypothetical protein